MGRTKINGEETLIRLEVGTLDRINAALKENEPRSVFFRIAVERELKKREKSTTTTD